MNTTLTNMPGQDKSPVPDEKLWVIWEASITKANRTGMSVAFVYAKAIENYHGIGLEINKGIK